MIISAGQQIRLRVESFQNANFLISQPMRDDFNEGHIIGFG